MARDRHRLRTDPRAASSDLGYRRGISRRCLEMTRAQQTDPQAARLSASIASWSATARSPVREEVVLSLPFGTLLHFAKDAVAAQPRVLVVAPLSGHFATLLRRHGAHAAARSRRLHHRLAQRARRAAGRGALRLRRLCRLRHPLPRGDRPGAHLLAVCQPCVQALAAVALMAEDGQPGAAAQHDADGGPDRHARSARPRSTSSRPRKPIGWFEQQADRARAVRYPGARPQGLSGLRAAHRLHVDEHGAAHQRASRALRPPGRRASTTRPSRSRASTTSISRCSTCRPSSTSRPSSRVFQEALLATRRADHSAAARSIPARSAAPRC